jgi:hypothetical protein
MPTYEEDQATLHHVLHNVLQLQTNDPLVQALRCNGFYDITPVVCTILLFCHTNELMFEDDKGDLVHLSEDHQFMLWSLHELHHYNLWKGIPFDSWNTLTA